MKAITVSGKRLGQDCFQVKATKTVQDDGKFEVDEWNTITSILRRQQQMRDENTLRWDEGTWDNFVWGD